MERQQQASFQALSFSSPFLSQDPYSLIFLYLFSHSYKRKLVSHSQKRPHPRGWDYCGLYRTIARQRGGRWIPGKLNTFIWKNTGSPPGFKGPEIHPPGCEKPGSPFKDAKQARGIDSENPQRAESWTFGRARREGETSQCEGAPQT